MTLYIHTQYYNTSAWYIYSVKIFSDSIFFKDKYQLKPVKKTTRKQDEVLTTINIYHNSADDYYSVYYCITLQGLHNI
ncbi:hypothetical protein ccbrp13_34530 [Ktedonobacteria bacterium brp13]|nr:hypothetical protein ccbrp13_34530 [Ktedonobacteria bacterium brp13]